LFVFYSSILNFISSKLTKKILISESFDFLQKEFHQKLLLIIKHLIFFIEAYFIYSKYSDFFDGHHTNSAYVYWLKPVIKSANYTIFVFD